MFTGGRVDSFIRVQINVANKYMYKPKLVLTYPGYFSSDPWRGLETAGERRGVGRAGQVRLPPAGPLRPPRARHPQPRRPQQHRLQGQHRSHQVRQWKKNRRLFSFPINDVVKIGWTFFKNENRIIYQFVITQQLPKHEKTRWSAHPSTHYELLILNEIMETKTRQLSQNSVWFQDLRPREPLLRQGPPERHAGPPALRLAVLGVRRLGRVQGQDQGDHLLLRGGHLDHPGLQDRKDHLHQGVSR